MEKREFSFAPSTKAGNNCMVAFIGKKPVLADPRSVKVTAGVSYSCEFEDKEKFFKVLTATPLHMELGIDVEKRMGLLTVKYGNDVEYGVVITYSDLSSLKSVYSALNKYKADNVELVKKEFDYFVKTCMENDMPEIWLHPDTKYYDGRKILSTIQYRAKVILLPVDLYSYKTTTITEVDSAIISTQNRDGAQYIDITSTFHGDRVLSFDVKTTSLEQLLSSIETEAFHNEEDIIAQATVLHREQYRTLLKRAKIPFVVKDKMEELEEAVVHVYRSPAGVFGIKDKAKLPKSGEYLFNTKYTNFNVTAAAKLRKF